VWPTIDCAAVFDAKLVASICGKHAGAVTANPAEGMAAAPIAGNAPTITLCMRELALDRAADHVVHFALYGYASNASREAQDARVRKAFGKLAKPPDTVVADPNPNYHRRDIEGGTGRFEYALFETTPTGTKPLCDDAALVKLTQRVRDALQ